MKQVEQAAKQRLLAGKSNVELPQLRKAFGKESFQDTPDGLEITWEKIPSDVEAKLKSLGFRKVNHVSGFTSGEVATYYLANDWAAFINEESFVIADVKGTREESASVETADDADLFPQGVKIGAGQRRLADKIVEGVGITEGMKHNLLVGMIAYILVHPDYTKEAGFDLASFKAAFRKVAPKLDQVLSPLQEQFE